MGDAGVSALGLKAFGGPAITQSVGFCFKNLNSPQSHDLSYREISWRHARKWELRQFIEGRLEWNFDFWLHSFCGDASLPFVQCQIWRIPRIPRIPC